MKRTNKPDVNDIITERIVALLETGVAPWHKAWASAASGQPQNLSSGKAYRGINVWLTMSAGFASPYFLTFKQAKAMGGSVRKGEKGTPVVFFNWLYTGADGKRVKLASDAVNKSGFWRYYTVFNIEQIDGIENPAAPEPVRDHEPIKEAELIVENMQQRPEITHGGGRAYYRPSTDTVNMPEADTFNSGEEYYSTLFHELAHSTGHESRLNRQASGKPRYRGSEDYSKEELVAEMTAAFLSGHAGIIEAVIDNSAAYIDGWIKALKGDNKLAIQAGSQAQKASDYILGVKW